MTIRLLVLGGTGEARHLAAWAVEQPGLEVVSSLAGRVSSPRLPVGGVRIGGFGGADGLAAYLGAEQVDAVVDATHPFAARISANAALACGRADVPLLALRRPGWVEQPGDRWHRVPDTAAAAALLPELGRRAFLTTGRQGLASFAALDDVWFLVRCVDPPDPPLPARREVLLARGPYAADDEAALMLRHRVDVLVTKDSGGDLTVGKLRAARELGLPVVVIDRPARPDVPTVTTVEEAARWVDELL